MSQQEELNKRLKFQRWIEEDIWKAEMDLNTFKDDNLAQFQTNTILSTLKHIWNMYDLVYGHDNIEELK